ncbi:MAG TPA: Ig-like domain-containing protein [Galbitalea sp.]|nr:Ig-like domain-containing protein [Galbitalea sp.]
MTVTGVQLFQQMKDKQDPLVLAPLNSLVFAHKWSIGADYIPDNICDPETGELLTLPVDWLTLGELQKKAGVDMTPDQKTSDVEGLGSLPARRTITTSEGLAIDFTAQEWRKVNTELYYGTDLSSTWANAVSGEWRGHKMVQSTSDYWSIIVLAFDGIVGSEIYPFWIFPKVMNTKAGKMSLADGSEIAFPSTLTCYQDAAYVSSDGVVGSFYDFGVSGVGNIPLAKIGGFMEVTDITVSPSTATLAHSPAGTKQLTVTDSNGRDVTAYSTFTSGTPDDATVSASGLVTAVAAGSSVITASYTPDGADEALTDTCTVTVS